MPTSGNRVVVDTYAWIEYFRGTEEGRNAREYIEGDFDLVCPAVVVAELSDKYRRNDLAETWRRERKPFVEVKCDAEPLDAELADRAGELKTEMRRDHDDFGLADATILATAERHDAKLLTGDGHLTGLERAIDVTDI